MSNTRKRAADGADPEYPEPPKKSPNEKPAQCLFCNKWYSRRQTMLKHVGRDHSREQEAHKLVLSARNSRPREAVTYSPLASLPLVPHCSSPGSPSQLPLRLVQEMEQLLPRCLLTQAEHLSSPLPQRLSRLHPSVCKCAQPWKQPLRGFCRAVPSRRRARPQRCTWRV